MNQLIYNYIPNRNFDIKLPAKTRKNGTLFLHVVLAVDDGKPLDFKHLQRDGPTVIQRVALTEYVVPKAATFNLLDDNVRQQLLIICTKCSISLSCFSVNAHCSSKVNSTCNTYQAKRINGIVNRRYIDVD